VTKFLPAAAAAATFCHRFNWTRMDAENADFIWFGDRSAVIFCGHKK